METVENKYITVAYKLYSIENGEKDFEEEAPVEHPFQFISGLGMTLEPFEAQIKDLQIGDKFDFTIPASEAYGEYDDDHVIDLPKEIFMIEGEFDSDRVVEGAVIPLMTSEGQRINGSVVEVKEDVVVMDMNHPLAGCDLNFTGEVVESRPATNEENPILVSRFHLPTEIQAFYCPHPLCICSYCDRLLLQVHPKEQVSLFLLNCIFYDEPKILSQTI